MTGVVRRARIARGGCLRFRRIGAGYGGAPGRRAWLPCGSVYCGRVLAGGSRLVRAGASLRRGDRPRRSAGVVVMRDVRMVDRFIASRAGILRQGWRGAQQSKDRPTHQQSYTTLRTGGADGVKAHPVALCL